jgi:hypothetical protein
VVVVAAEEDAVGGGEPGRPISSVRLLRFPTLDAFLMLLALQAVLALQAGVRPVE